MRKLPLRFLVILATAALVLSMSATASASEADVTVTNVTVSPESVEVGENVTITATLENTGNITENVTVVFKINGEEVKSVNVTVEANATETAECVVAEDEAGTYEVTVDGVSASFTVTVPSTPTPSPTPSPTPTPTPTPTPEVTSTPTPEVTPTPTTPVPTTPVPSEAAFRLAPSVSLTSTKTTIKAKEPAIFTLSMINPLVNDVDLTVQSILKVSSGVHITATSFAASGSNQFTGTFKVRPGEENHITIQVTSEEVGPKVIESQIIYYPGEDKSKFSQLQQTMSINAKEKSITIPTPPPGETSTPTPTSGVPGFEMIFAIAGLLAVAYLVGRKK